MQAGVRREEKNVTDRDFALPERDERAGKWSFGRALLVCGSRDCSGAALMACGAALRSGAGLVQLATAEKGIDAARVLWPEALLLPLPETDGGNLSRDGLAAVLREARRADSLLFGCGVGRSDDGLRFLRGLLEEWDGPMVIDADGLNLLAEGGGKALLSETGAKCILTPHLREFSRLTGRSVSELKDDPVGEAERFAREWGAVTVLKGAETVVTDGRRTLFAGTANSGLAKGGSGDVLAGLCAGLCAQMPEDPLGAAVLAVRVHGEAGLLARRELGARGMLPRDVIDRLPRAFLAAEKEEFPRIS